MKRDFLLTILVSCCVAPPAFAEGPHALKKIVVTPSRIETHNIPRSITILDREAIDASPYNAIADIIGNVGGIDMRRRGAEGVQADINIRGANFEENSVLIDGVRINDPQTGHYNMDLPLAMSDVERVEVLKGPASSVYGANSFGGVINVITKRPEEERLTMFSEGGSYDYFNGGLSVECPFGIFANRLSFEESRSTGYRPETEFSIMSLSNSVSAKTPVGLYDFLFGYTKKDFGADSFYSNLFPNEEEHTDTRFFKIAGDVEEGPLKMRPCLYLKRHFDKFALDRNRPGWQTNYHTSYTKGAEFDFLFENELTDAAYGFEISRDTIDSTNIQTHKQDRRSLYGEISPHIMDGLYLNLSLREDHFSNFGWQSSPSVSASYALTGQVKVRSSIGRAYRIPTFTDLYYGDAANVGNSLLRPETAWSYEAGADIDADYIKLSATYFHRDSFDTIDWIRTSTRNPWRASNIGTVDTNGVECSINLTPDKICGYRPIEKIFFDYTALDQHRKHDYFSKYALDYLKQHITTGVEFDLSGFRNYWVLNYKKRIGDSGFMVVDTKITKDIVAKDKITLQAFLEVTNLFDVDYSEQSDIPMPGRWIKSGAKLKF